MSAALKRPPWLSPDAPWKPQQPDQPVWNPNPKGCPRGLRRGPRDGLKRVNKGFTRAPDKWPDDGGAKRVPIYDGQSRLVRRVGWVNCLSPSSLNRPHRFISPDVQRVRMCAACKHLVENSHHHFRL